MTKRELLESLEKFPDDMEIALSKDNSGTEASVANDVNLMFYVAHNNFSGELEEPENQEDVAEDDLDEEDSEKMIVIWPSS